MANRQQNMASFWRSGYFRGPLVKADKFVNDSKYYCNLHLNFYHILKSSLKMNPNCVFCNIYNEKEPATILYKDNDIVIFPDIRPASKHHYLIVPRDHITNAKVLKKEHIYMVENLVKHGKRILEEKQAVISDARFGFHWSFFSSVPHLHLHAISPASEMSFVNKMIFKEGSLWFVTPQYVLERLEKL